jgi:two-component system, chemotaxis family, CheB/CheR fusion protein
LVGQRILVVDDTADTMDVTRLMLEMEGAQVETAMNGVDALRIAENKDFDLILSDISMPEMDGYELLSELRKLPRASHVPAIALTGFGRSEDLERARTAGFFTHLTKPIMFDQLLDAIQVIISNREQKP